MFRTFRRKFLPNPFESGLKKCAKRGGKKILLGWNRGLGDIALGIYPMIQKIWELIPGAEISILTRADLQEGFSLLRGVNVLIDRDLVRWKKGNIYDALSRLEIAPGSFDVIFPNPSPTEWMISSRGKIIPKLEWEGTDCSKVFDLPSGFTYIGVQVIVETPYGKWRNWPKEQYEFLFSRIAEIPSVKILLLGGENIIPIEGKNIIDLRGKTTLGQLLSLLRYTCRSVLLPDSGILSMAYYLNQSFPLQVVSLWADPNHGILKQGVPSPNKELLHTPLIGAKKDLSTVSVDQVMNALFPPKPFTSPMKAVDFEPTVPLKGVGAILLAGGQGTRLGMKGPKGTLEIFGKSLFEHILKKAPKKDFPIAVMTSPLNDLETFLFFKKNNFFEREVYFFQQKMDPFYDQKKRKTAHFAPSGNGSVFKSFVSSPVFSIFKDRGVDLLNIVPVDNLLGDPADGKLIQCAREQSVDILVKCVKKGAREGALIEREGKIEIQEYTDLDPSAAFPFGNTGMMAISVAFFEKMGKKELPHHLVKKKIPGTKKWGYKKEQFLFDVFPFGAVKALLYDRESSFFPIKEKQDLQRVLNDPITMYDYLKKDN